MIPTGKEILSPGAHNELIRAVIEEFVPRFAPDSVLLHVGNTGKKWGYFYETSLAELDIGVDARDKMPDVLFHYGERDWLLLVELITSHGPVDGKRHAELAARFSDASAGLAYVTVFPNRSAMERHLGEITWETVVWLADNPSHLIHFDGERLLEPCDTA